MGLTLISQPAQALTWDFSFDAANSYTDQMTFNGTLTTDGTAVVPDQIYNVTDAAGSLVYNGVSSGKITLTVLEASGNFKWDGVQLLLNDTGISFSGTDDGLVNGPLAKIYCASGSCQVFQAYGSSDNFKVNVPFVPIAVEDLTVGSSSMSPATPVPWETDALPVIGSTLLFAGGVWAKRKLAKPFNND